MAKKSRSEPLKPPSITKVDGRKRLTKLIERGEALLAQRPLKEGQQDIWSTLCIETLEATFGEGSSHIYTFIGPVQVRVSSGDDSYDYYAEKRDAEGLSRQIGVLKSLVDQIDLEIGFEEPVKQDAPDFWSDIHPTIVRVAKGRYGAGQFADAVEAAFKEINNLIKDHVKRKTGNELDGASLMNTAFSPNSPVIVLDDVNTKAGQDTQLGYMQIYAGSMTGIRNPKAHANITINDIRARHFLYLASLLLYRFDERL
jgi:uncharacterized protein (TIGR02391 family)